MVAVEDTSPPNSDVRMTPRRAPAAFEPLEPAVQYRFGAQYDGDDHRRGGGEQHVAVHRHGAEGKGDEGRDLGGDAVVTGPACLEPGCGDV